MSSDLRLTEEKNELYTKINISGEIDIFTTQALKDKLYGIIDTEKTDLKLDCEGLTYIDSTGLGVLVGALKRAKQHERKIIITNLKENIKKLFLITNLDKVFIIEG